MTTLIDIHQVKQVTKQKVVFDTFEVLEFIILDDKGSKTRICLFSADYEKCPIIKTEKTRVVN